jgi:hypothetical protein
MAFQKPRILTDSEANTIRGKCLMNDHAGMRPSASEVMLLIGHFDLVEQKLRSALETLSGCLPPKIFVYGAYGENWTDFEGKAGDEYETIDFKEILGEE